MKTILVTDTQTSLGMEVITLLLDRGFNVIAAPSDKQEKKAYDRFKKKPLSVVQWNRTSPLSTKNMILSGVKKFGTLEAALILETPSPEHIPFEEVKYVDIERVLDARVKGSLFLLKELYDYFSVQKNGVVTFVNLSRKKDSRLLLEDLCRESLLTAAEGLVQNKRSGFIKVNTILSRATDEKSYAEFIVKTLTEKCYKTSGKLFYFQW